MERLKQIIESLADTIDACGLKISDETLFIQSCSYHRGEIANENRGNSKRGESPNANMPTKPATAKQINLMKKLKIKYPGDVSLIEAKKLIETKLGKDGKNNNRSDNNY